MKEENIVSAENNAWSGFKGEKWKKEINVSDFIDNNYKEYKGDDSFLAPSTKKTQKVWKKCEKLLALERKYTAYFSIFYTPRLQKARG